MSLYFPKLYEDDGCVTIENNQNPYTPKHIPDCQHDDDLKDDEASPTFIKIEPPEYEVLSESVNS